MIRFCARHPVTVGMGTLAVALFGLLAGTRLPVDLLPDLAYPTLTLRSEFEGAAPAEVEELLTRPVEEAVGIVTGVRRIVSRSMSGVSEIQLQFAWGRDMDFAALDVREQLDRVRFPEGATRPLVLRYDPSLEPVVRIGVFAGDESPEDVRDIVERVIERNLETVEGVAAVRVLGGVEEEIRVMLDQDRLFALGLSPEAVRSRLAAENLNRAGGALIVDESRHLVRVINDYVSAADLGELVLTVRDGRKVLLGDVAAVVRQPADAEVITRVDGRETVELAVHKEGDANTVTVSGRVFERLEDLADRLPPGWSQVTILDQSRFIRASAGEVASSAFYGGLLAVLVLFCFLRDFRSTVVVALTIPVSILATFFLMLHLGVSLNIVSLGGIALGIGMLVDNSIVVLESIARLRETGVARLDAAIRGAQEVATPVIASTVTTCAVFLPIVFVDGIAGQLFGDLALAVVASLTASLVVSLTLIPTLLGGGDDEAAGWADPNPDHPEHSGRIARWTERWFVGGGSAILRFARWGWRGMGRLASGGSGPLMAGFERVLEGFTSRYPGIVRGALARRKVVFGASLLVLFGGAVLLPRVGVELLPELAQGSFHVDVELPQGTALKATARAIRELEAGILSVDGVESVATIVGSGDLSESDRRGSHGARLTVSANGNRDRQQEVVAGVRRFLATKSDVVFEVRNPTIFTFESPLSVEVYGDDLGSVGRVAEAVADRMRGESYVTDVHTSVQDGNPEVVVTFDPDRLARAGLEISRAAELVRQRLEGVVATRIRSGDRVTDVRVLGQPSERASIGALEDMILNPGAAVPIRLRSVAEFEEQMGPREIRRIGQERCAVVSAAVDADTDLGAAAKGLEAALSDLPVPAGVRVEISGQNREMEESFASLRFALALALFLVYLVMASQFESLLHPFVILLTIPLGLVGALVAVAAGGHSVDVLVLIGAVMLTGIVVNNSIVLVDAVNRLRRQGLDARRAVVQAGSMRLRPILMTTTTTVLALVPMALGLGEGGELRAPLAVAVIGGLILATVVTLVVVPVLYDVFSRRDR